MLSLTRPALIAAGLGGCCWTVKVLGLTATDGSFGGAEAVFFVGGLIALLAASVLVAHSVTRPLHGVARVAAVAAVAVGLLAATVALEAIGHGALAAIASGDNVGLEEEGGILLAGIAWMALAYAGRGDHRPANRAVTA